MGLPTVIPTDLVVQGAISAQSMNIPNGTVVDADVASNANVATSKLQHRNVIPYNQPNTTATSERRAIYVQNGTTGNLISFEAGSIVICAGAATITVDLQVGGASVLTAAITLNSSSTDRALQSASIPSPASSGGAWYEIVITATAGGGTIGTGVFARLIADETAI